MRSRTYPGNSSGEAAAQNQAVGGEDLEDGRVDYVSSTRVPLAIQPNINEGNSLTPSFEDKDKAWAVAFKINVLVTLVAAILFGSKAFDALASSFLFGDGPRRSQLGDNSDGRHATLILLGVTAAAVIISSLVTLGIFRSMVCCSENILLSLYFLVAGIWGLVGLLTVNFVPRFGISCFTTSALVFYVIHRGKKRIAFASANLKVAALAIQSMPWTIWSTLLIGGVQLLWCAVVAVAALGSFVALANVAGSDGASFFPLCGSALEMCEFSGLGILLLIMWLISMAWTCSVFRNIVSCTVTGSVASWWFTLGEGSKPVQRSLRRATHSSLGSLCKAGAVQFLIAVTLNIVHLGLYFRPIAFCLIFWAAQAVVYLLSYAVCFIGIYGLNFSTAKCRVRELFERRIVTTLANDIIISVGLSLLAASAIIVYVLVDICFFSIVLLQVFSENKGIEWYAALNPILLLNNQRYFYLDVYQVVGYITCLLVVLNVLEVVNSGYKAVFVCFVQDPEAFAQNHGSEAYERLNEAWLKMDGLRNQLASANYAPDPAIML